MITAIIRQKLFLLSQPLKTAKFPRLPLMSRLLVFPLTGLMGAKLSRTSPIRLSLKVSPPTAAPHAMGFWLYFTKRSFKASARRA